MKHVFRQKFFWFVHLNYLFHWYKIVLDGVLRAGWPFRSALNCMIRIKEFNDGGSKFLLIQRSTKEVVVGNLVRNMINQDFDYSIGGSIWLVFVSSIELVSNHVQVW